MTYLCYRTHDVDDVIYNAPAGYTITSFVDLVNQYDAHGSTGVTTSPDQRALTVHAEANGHICFEDSGVCADCPDEVDKWTGWARRQVQVQLRSTEPTKKVGTRTSLLITTRGLCCCPTVVRPMRPGILFIDLPRDLAVVATARPVPAAVVGVASSYSTEQAGQPRPPGDYPIAAQAAAQKSEGDCHCGDEPASRAAVVSSIRRANALSDAIREELTKRVTSAQLRPWSSSLLETDLFSRKLEGVISRSRRGRDLRAQRVELPSNLANALARRLKRRPEELSRRDVLRYQSDDLARETGMPVDEIQRLKLTALGLRVRRRDTEDNGGGRGGR